MMLKILFRLASISLILLFASSCQNRTDQTASPPGTAADTGGLTSDQVTTLNSLERVDEYPLYVMHYTGEYASASTIRANGNNGTTWGCSLFTALGDEEQMLYGRNFDWEYSPALLLFTDPPDGYASVSMVDIAYLGFKDKKENLVQLPLSKRESLLQAPLMPFDGMNEYGLVIAMAAVPESKMPHDPGKPTIDSLSVMRQVLDHARSVNEATDILAKYNIEWGGGPPLHYLIADREGQSVLVEFYDGKMVFLPNDTPWHLATNHLRVTAQGDGWCDRYAKVDRKLTSSGGKLTFPDALQLLSDVSQGGYYPTQWSVVYGISTGEIKVVMGREYGQQYPFELPLVRK